MQMKSISQLFASFPFFFFREKKKPHSKKTKKPYKELLTSINTNKKPLLWMFPLLLVWEHLMLQTKHKCSPK